MSFLFLTVGMTHSGKTTFGKRLRESLGDSAKFIHVDNDVADEFLRENFNNLRIDPAILATRTPTNPDLRLLVPQLIVDYALKEGYSAIATASHPRRAIRRSYYKIAKKNNAKVVLLILKISEEQATARLKAANRSTGILDTRPFNSTSFHDLYNKQKQIFEWPTAAEKQSCYKVFEINPENSESILEACASLTALKDM